MTQTPIRQRDTETMTTDSPVRSTRVAAPGGAYITVLRAGDLFADLTYQRPLDERRVDNMVENYDRSLVGVLEVSWRDDGGSDRYAIIDGHHRWAMLRDIDARGDDTPIACQVHVGLTMDQEAALFRDIDKGRRALTTWDRWRARLAAGEPDVASIDGVIKAAGLSLSERAGRRIIRAPRACEEVFAYGGTTLLTETLSVITSAWGDGQDSYAAELLVGVALVRIGTTDLDLARLTEGLSATTPRQVGARARALAETQSGSLGRLAAFIVIQCYNRTPGPKVQGIPSAGWYGQLRRADRSLTGKGQDLADRRSTVAELTAAGKSANEIATRLGTSQRQVARDRAALAEQRAS